MDLSQVRCDDIEEAHDAEIQNEACTPTINPTEHICSEECSNIEDYHRTEEGIHFEVPLNEDEPEIADIVIPMEGLDDTSSSPPIVEDEQVMETSNEQIVRSDIHNGIEDITRQRPRMSTPDPIHSDHIDTTNDVHECTPASESGVCGENESGGHHPYLSLLQEEADKLFYCKQCEMEHPPIWHLVSVYTIYSYVLRGDNTVINATFFYTMLRMYV